MDPHQRQRLREYEYRLENARYGFFGADWLTALLLFEALDNDYMYVGDLHPSTLETSVGKRRLGWWRLGWWGLRWGRFLTPCLMTSPRFARGSAPVAASIDGKPRGATSWA